MNAQHTNLYAQINNKNNISPKLINNYLGHAFLHYIHSLQIIAHKISPHADVRKESFGTWNLKLARISNSDK